MSLLCFCSAHTIQYDGYRQEGTALPQQRYFLMYGKRGDLAAWVGATSPQFPLKWRAVHLTGLTFAKNGEEHTPIIFKSTRNTEIFILLVLLQTLDSCSSTYQEQMYWGGREGTRRPSLYWNRDGSAACHPSPNMTWVGTQGKLL